jgi:hypothetical protein
MTKWYPLPTNNTEPGHPRSWLEILTSEAPPPSRANRRNEPIKPSPVPAAVETPVPPKTAPVATPAPLIDLVEGVYEPIFMYCDDCGLAMFRQLDTWRCWCGRSIENFASERHIKR